VKDNGNEGRKVNQEEIPFPEGGPWEIEKQGSHFEANDDQKCAKDPVHS